MSTENTTSARRGRPTLEGSARQAKLAKQAAKIAAGGSILRGRPSNPESKRQAKITSQEVKKAAGFIIKPGRPKTIVNTEAATEVAA